MDGSGCAYWEQNLMCGDEGIPASIRGCWPQEMLWKAQECSVCGGKNSVSAGGK